MIDAFLAKLRVRDDVSAAEEALLRKVLERTERFPAGRVLIKEGDRVTQSMLLVEGFACRTKAMADGGRQILELNIPGDFVDLHGFLLHRLDHDLETVTDCTFAFVGHDDLRAITEDQPHLARLMWMQTVIDAAIHRSWVASLGRRPAIGRIAHLFIELQIRLGLIGRASADGFDLPLKQAQLAEIAGLTEVHINRTLKVLREHGLCTFRNGRVEIHDARGLRDTAEFDDTYLSLEKRRR